MTEWHLITGEFPPQRGGVSDYTHALAAALAAAGDGVHVWCPPGPRFHSPAEAAESEPRRASRLETPGVEVHRELGQLSPRDLHRVGIELDRFPAPRRILVQWVPHSYGYRSLNLPFCLWLWRRAHRSGDRVEIMVHEPYLPFRRGAWRQNVAASVHRLMTVILLRAACRVWVSTPAWEARWRRYTPRPAPPFGWLPIPSAVPVVHDTGAIASVRARLAPDGRRIVGHFSTYRGAVSDLLAGIVEPLLAREPDCVLLLLGRGSEQFRQRLLEGYPEWSGRVHATGGLPAEELSIHLSACHVLVQPYPDGVNGRQSSMTAGLSHGCAMVTTEGENTESIWRRSGAVALVPVGNPGAAVVRIIDLLAGPDQRARLAHAARALYSSHFEMSQSISSLRQDV